MRFAFEHLQAEDGGSVYLRLSTRPVEQPERTMTRDAGRGDRWQAPTGCASRRPAASSPWSAWARVLPEVLEAADQLATICPGSACWW